MGHPKPKPRENERKRRAPKVATAPADDEPLTPNEELAIREGLAAVERGDVITDEELKRRLGL